MEGEVLVPGVPLSALLAVGSVVLGGVFGMLRWFAARLLADIEQRLSRIDALASEVERIEDRLQAVIADMPLQYQRREDAIRQAAELDRKLDRIYEALLDIQRSR